MITKQRAQEPRAWSLHEIPVLDLADASNTGLYLVVVDNSLETMRMGTCNIDPRVSSRQKEGQVRHDQECYIRTMAS